MTPLDVKCLRAREWISCELDRELSPFERALLGAHVGRCAECSRVRTEWGGVARALRESALEPLPRPVVVHGGARFRLGRAGLTATAAAAATFVVAVLTGLSSSVPVGGPAARSASAADVVVDNNVLIRQVKQRDWRPNPIALKTSRRSGLELL